MKWAFFRFNKMKYWKKGLLIGGLMGLLIWVLSFITELHEIFGFVSVILNKFFDLRDIAALPCKFFFSNYEAVGWCWLGYGAFLDAILGMILGLAISIILNFLRKRAGGWARGSGRF